MSRYGVFRDRHIPPPPQQSPALGTLTKAANVYVLTCTAGSATAAGASADVLRSRAIVASAGAATAAGVAATVSRNLSLTGSAGSATAAGVAASVLRSRYVSGASGTATASGVSAGVLLGRKIVAAEGAATAAGVSADLTYTPAATAYTLTADPGAAVAAGESADLTIAAAPVQRVEVVGRAGRRVLVRIENGQVYEVGDEQEAKKVVRAIRRKVERQIRRAEREHLPPPEIPDIQVIGAEPFVESLRREVETVAVNWNAIRRKLEDDLDEDDVEALLL